jgi:hypothetical protein
MAKKTAEVTEKVVESWPVKLIRMDLRIIDMTVVGDSGLICNRWSEKAKKQMRDKQMKRAKDAKEAKDPEECFKGSLYEYPGGGHGFPATAQPFLLQSENRFHGNRYEAEEGSCASSQLQASGGLSFPGQGRGRRRDDRGPQESER